MINQLMKWGVLLGIWKRYGAAIKMLPVLLVTLVLVYALHADYVEYAQVSEHKQNLALSFLLKWGAIAAVVLVYVAYVKQVVASKQPNNLKTRLTKKSALDNAKQTQEKAPSAVSDKPPEPSQDPFANIRKKKQLRSKADVIIDSKR